jgi:hypothetical protein
MASCMPTFCGEAMTEERAPARELPLATVTLREQRDADGFRRLSVDRRPDGGIFIEGHDLGAGVERSFGAGLSEYEWAWVVGPDAVPALIAALGGREHDDPLRLLAAWSTTHDGADPGPHLRAAGVPIEFWNRVGD